MLNMSIIRASLQNSYELAEVKLPLKSSSAQEDSTSWKIRAALNGLIDVLYGLLKINFLRSLLPLVPITGTLKLLQGAVIVAAKLEVTLTRNSSRASDEIFEPKETATGQVQISAIILATGLPRDSGEELIVRRNGNGSGKEEAKCQQEDGEEAHIVGVLFADGFLFWFWCCRGREILRGQVGGLRINRILFFLRMGDLWPILTTIRRVTFYVFLDSLFLPSNNFTANGVSLHVN